MTIYNYTKNIKADLLESEIISSGLIDIEYINTVGDEVFIFFNEELSEEQKILLDSVVSLHTESMPLQLIIKNKILESMDFGRNLMAEYGASNVIAELSLEQVQYIIDKTLKLQAALNTGALYVALTELDLLETDDVVITTAKITEFRHKIQDYLGIDRT